MRRASSNEKKVWPVFPIGPILEHYGGDHVLEGYGWRPYRCPFHGDRSASASVSELLNLFVCHGCEIKGNAVQVIMKQEKAPYGDALRRAKEITGKSAGDVQSKPDPRSGVPGRSGNRAGTRKFRRPGRRD